MDHAACARERFAVAQLRGDIDQYKIKFKVIFTEKTGATVGVIVVAIAHRVTRFVFATNRFPVF